MGLVLAIGGQGDGKSMILAEIAYKKYHGEYDPILKSDSKNRYTPHANGALYFCNHPPKRTIDVETGEMSVEASCDCLLAQKNGDLNPLSLIKRVRTDPKFLYYVVLFFTEFHRWADSHLSMQLPANLRIVQMLLEYLVDESRKRRFWLLMDSQARMKVSNRIRDAAGNSYIILCKNYALDKESLHPALEYIIIKDVLSWNQRYWVFRPGPKWVKFYGGLFNSWETPSRITEVELGWGGVIPDIPDDAESIIGTTEDKADDDLNESDPTHERSVDVKRAILENVQVQN